MAGHDTPLGVAATGSDVRTTGMVSVNTDPDSLQWAGLFSVRLKIVSSHVSLFSARLKIVSSHVSLFSVRLKIVLTSVCSAPG